MQIGRIVVQDVTQPSAAERHRDGRRSPQGVADLPKSRPCSGASVGQLLRHDLDKLLRVPPSVLIERRYNDDCLLCSLWRHFVQHL